MRTFIIRYQDRYSKTFKHCIMRGFMTIADANEAFIDADLGYPIDLISTDRIVELESYIVNSYNGPHRGKFKLKSIKLEARMPHKIA